MNPDQQSAYIALADNGWLIDPRYAHDPIREEARLKAIVKKHWRLRKDFPAFVQAYVSKWSHAAPRTEVGAPRVPDSGSSLG